MSFVRPELVAAARRWQEALAGGAAAQDCDAGKPGGELTGAEAQAVYDCLEGALHEGYTSGDDTRWIPQEFVASYRDWQMASTRPGAPGFHANRYLVTWVNDTGFDEYVKYAEDPDIPAGTVIAKESFSVGEDGSASPGPLFFMQKVEAGTSPETNDWYYMLLSPQGAPQAVDVMTACNECHMGAFGDTGGLGYPIPEARLSN